MALVIPYEDLTDYQKEVIEERIDTEENLLITGPPGSGKTLVSLYIAKFILDSQITNNILMLIYNHSLNAYLKSAFDELGITTTIIDTKDRFFREQLCRNFCNSIPDREDDEKYEVWYNQVLDAVIIILPEIDLTFDIVILDEIQDFNIKELEILRKIGERFILLGDYDQKLYPINTPRDISELENIFEPLKIFKFEKVFRFGSALAEILSKFAPPNTVLETAEEDTNDNLPRFYKVRNHQEALEKLVDLLRDLLTRDETIGVVAPQHDILQEVREKLLNENIDFIYYEKGKLANLENHDFHDPIPILLTTYSVKGLEFDNVILFGFYNYLPIFGLLGHNLKQHLYVALSRTKENLFIFITDDTINELKELYNEYNEEKFYSPHVLFGDDFDFEDESDDNEDSLPF